MAGFDKDDYLNDLPDPDDPILHTSGASASGGAGQAAGTFAGTAGVSSGQNEGQDMTNENDNSDQRSQQGAEQNGASADGKLNGNGAARNAGANSGSGERHDVSSQTGGNDVSDAAEGSGQNANGDTASNQTESDGGDTLTPLGQAKKEAAEYLDALQRERAEFVNFRNRAQKEQDVFRQHGITDVLTALLPALDDIDRIRQHSDIDESFSAVATKIDKAFEKFGVEKFGKQGEDFDPTKHEAILHKPDASATKETVDTVVEAGYRIGDRVIRAARVVVVSPQA